jgi:hypothetical protein
MVRNCLSETMLRQTPLPDKNEIQSGLKVQIVLPLLLLPGSNNIPPGAHSEARGLLLRFPPFVGFGIATPSPNPCPGMRAPIQLSSVEIPGEENPEEPQ